MPTERSGRTPGLKLPRRGAKPASGKKGSARPRSGAAVPVLVAVCLTLNGCAVLESLKEKLGVLGMRFSLKRVDVSRLVYPTSLLSAAAGVFLPDRSLLGQFGVDIECGIRAANSHPAR